MGANVGCPSLPPVYPPRQPSQRPRHLRRCVSLGAHVILFSVYNLPPYVSEEALVQTLNPYGMVKAVTYATLRDRPDDRTGTRVANVEMTNPIPNFITVQGHRVVVDYRGFRCVCTSGRRKPQSHSSPEIPDLLLRHPLQSKEIPSRPTVPRKTPTLPSFDECHPRLLSTQPLAPQRRLFPKTAPCPIFFRTRPLPSASAPPSPMT
ncbi:hypothetical protein HPB47_012865 [Ixodes persulcatus]|uniref:Uncharacterized protein n=1 Tax=Ixodes persulcatus TaxID=34615 RepID=A0AC60NSE6_IXOPE|nr:hypothetical protein HPB47_012865 [Ixodes persulcatus]